LVDDTVVITLATRLQVAIPRNLLQGLQGATPRQLAKVEIESPGTGLHWPLLDVDHYIPAIPAGVFGTRRWMSELGRRGGMARSAAKATAARINGRNGGRPRTIVAAFLGRAWSNHAALVGSQCSPVAHANCDATVSN